MNVALQTVPANEDVRRIEAGQGETFDVAGTHLTWKVKSQTTAYAFSVCEQLLDTGEGVPLHSHPYAEVFYVLEGTVDFLCVKLGTETWLRAGIGSTLIVPANALHAFYNKQSHVCRLLGISTPLHQAFFDAIQEADRETPFSALPMPQAMARVAEIGATYQMSFAPYEVTAKALNT